MSMAPQDYDYLRNLVKERSGISLSDDKTYLIESRLVPLIRELNLNDIAALVSQLKGNRDEKVITDIIEAMTTNETSFFRDLKPFDLFRDEILPHLQQENKESAIRIWCAACSSGQEPYSLALTALENRHKLGSKNIEIMATDIDKTILKKASDGIYSQFEVQRGLPITLLMKYFTQLEEYGEKWQVKDEVKKMITFTYLNLMENYISMGKCDVIFCRNVLIYFEPEMKTQILNKLADCLKPHGTIFLGSSETITDLTDKLKQFNNLRGVFCLA